MGIASRDYYRDTTASSWAMGDTPVVKYLILINVAVFLLQIFSARDVRVTPQEMADRVKRQYPDVDPAEIDRLLEGQTAVVERVSPVTDWLALDPLKTVNQGQVWRLITHAFCHDRNSLFHILFNMLLLFWFGPTLEQMFGPREFLAFYLTGALAAAVAHVGLAFYTGRFASAVGASGAVTAVLMLYTWHYPRHVIYLFWILPLEMRWAMAFYLVWDLYPVLLALSGDRVTDGIGHAAHLGGLAFGFLYAKYQWRLDRLAVAVPRVRRKQTSRPRLRIAPGTGRVPNPEADGIDRILEKISRTGRESLTDEEHSALRAASERLRARKRDLPLDPP